MATLYEIKENINKLEIERQNLADYIAEKAADPNVTVDELNEKKAKMEEFSDRIAMPTWRRPRSPLSLSRARAPSTRRSAASRPRPRSTALRSPASAI